MSSRTPGSRTRWRTPPTRGSATPCTRWAIALGGTGQWGYKDDYIPHHEPFQFYASTANPHHLTVPTNASGQDTLAGLHEIGRDTQSYVHGVPQFNTPNHNYDMSDFDQLVSAINHRELPALGSPGCQLPQGPGL